MERKSYMALILALGLSELIFTGCANFHELQDLNQANQLDLYTLRKALVDMKVPQHVLELLDRVIHRTERITVLISALSQNISWETLDPDVKRKLLEALANLSVRYSK